MKKTVTKYRHFMHGGDYNPEQWIHTPQIWEEDVRFMKMANCNTATVGIFSWSFLEPEEGVYNFDIMDEIVDKLTQNGIQIVLATPSGARPRWLAAKYPEVLRVNEDGVRSHYGRRHNHCYTSPVYREKTEKINRALAERYKDNPSIVLWHVSNEYGGECHCELCQAAFREWLRKKYDNDLDKLNHEWWTGFWSHSVSSWEEIESPLANGDSVLSGHILDWKRFVTYQTTDFLRHEIKPLKEITPDIPVTTNMMGPYQDLDYWAMRDAVDVISWDAYPQWHSDRGNEAEAYSIAFAHDMHRCMKDKPFILMESTPSLVNWREICKLKKPGMHKLSSMQAVAHGSDSVMYFQWRKGRGGSEKFHGAVIGHDGLPAGRVFDDVAEVGAALQKMDEILGSQTQADIAVIYEFRNRWALKHASGFQNSDKKYNATCKDHYKCFWKRGLNVDVVNSMADLSKYKIVVAPMLYTVSEAEIANLQSYVARGGTLIATYISGYANENDLCYYGGFPGGELKNVFGLKANEIDTLYPNEQNTVTMDGRTYMAVDYCELIEPATAETLAVYNTDFYAGMPAVLKNEYGMGTAYYIGFRDDGQLIQDLYEKILTERGIANSFIDHFPAGVSAHTRQDDTNIYMFIENYSGEKTAVNINGSFTDMGTGEAIAGKIVLDNYDVRILKRSLNPQGLK